MTRIVMYPIIAAVMHFFTVQLQFSLLLVERHVCIWELFTQLLALFGVDVRSGQVIVPRLELGSALAGLNVPCFYVGVFGAGPQLAVKTRKLGHYQLELQQKQSLIGEVGGLGLMLGIELVRDRESKEPADTETLGVLELTKERGLLIGKRGLHDTVIRIQPPMCIKKDDADFIIECLDEALTIG